MSSIAKEIERQLVGESKETAQRLLEASQLLLKVLVYPKRAGFIVALIAPTLLPKGLSVFALTCVTFLSFMFVRDTVDLYMSIRYGRKIKVAKETICYLMNQAGSHSIADWLARKNDDLGTVIEMVVSK